jgi:hypothetical protein
MNPSPRVSLTIAFVAALLALASAVMFSPAQSQRRARQTVPLDVAPSGVLANGEIWFRADTTAASVVVEGPFVYSLAESVSFGPEVQILANRRLANASGPLRMGETGTTPVNPGEGGWMADRTYRLVKVRGVSADASTTANCSTFIQSDEDTVLTLVWDANHEMWNPTADSSGGWVAPAARVVIDSSDVLSLTTGAGGSVLPDFPMVWLTLREEVTH